jgi:hypothetical protein
MSPGTDDAKVALRDMVVNVFDIPDALHMRIFISPCSVLWVNAFLFLKTVVLHESC